MPDDGRLPATTEPTTSRTDGVAWSSVDAPLATTCAGSGHTIVFVHGFTQTGQSWRPVAERFVRAGRRCVLVDLPGHGASAAVRADLPTAAALLGDSVGRITPSATVVGYSLGGRVCLHLAIARPSLVDRLVTIGAHPGIEDDAARAERREADERLAARLVAIGLDAFLREWVAQPLFGSLQPTDADLADRERNTVDGLASSLRSAGTGTQQPLWAQLPTLAMPVLAMAGRDDTKFAAIAARLADGVQRGQSLLVDGASHAAHLEQPDAVASAIEQFIAATPR